MHSSPDNFVAQGTASSSTLFWTRWAKRAAAPPPITMSCLVIMGHSSLQHALEHAISRDFLCQNDKSSNSSSTSKAFCNSVDNGKMMDIISPFQHPPSISRSAPLSKLEINFRNGFLGFIFDAEQVVNVSSAELRFTVNSEVNEIENDRHINFRTDLQTILMLKRNTNYPAKESGGPADRNYKMPSLYFVQQFKRGELKSGTN